MNFDAAGARQAGYGDAEIIEYLWGSGYPFDFDGARQAGYSDAEILDELSAPGPGRGAIDGAPFVTLQEVAAVRGAPALIVAADGTLAQVQYALMEADDLVTDRDQYGRENAAYAIARDPSAVPGRYARETAVSGITTSLDPARLGVADTDEAGSPVVDVDGQVVAGNARAQALRRIYVSSDGNGPQAYGSKAFDYRSWLQQEAPVVGIDPAQVAAMSKPVLVRIRSTPSEYRVDMEARR